jgi:hypothetical protein
MVDTRVAKRAELEEWIGKEAFDENESLDHRMIQFYKDMGYTVLFHFQENNTMLAFEPGARINGYGCNIAQFKLSNYKKYILFTISKEKKFTYIKEHHENTMELSEPREDRFYYTISLQDQRKTGDESQLLTLSNQKEDILQIYSEMLEKGEEMMSEYPALKAITSENPTKLLLREILLRSSGAIQRVTILKSHYV